jgi:uncharacterized oxidoreductase
VRLSSRTVLVTGGSSGIGRALVRRFHAAGCQVIATARRPEPLTELARELPGLVTIASDAGAPEARARLVEEAFARFPALDVWINNAGIQRRIDLTRAERWDALRDEIAVNLDGPIHFATLVVPRVRERPQAALINVSSGLAFVPSASVPIYSATKAALHAFTLALRRQLRSTSIEVVEVIPPAVRSNLGGAHDFGIDTDEYADSVMAQLADGRVEVTYEFSAAASQAGRAQLDEMFDRLNG